MYKYILLLLLIGCNEQTRKDFFPTNEEKLNTIRYYKDDRTNLCFIVNNVYSSPMNSEVFTSVPCTTEVEKLIQENRRDQ